MKKKPDNVKQTEPSEDIRKLEPESRERQQVNSRLDQLAIEMDILAHRPKRR